MVAALHHTLLVSLASAGNTQPGNDSAGLLPDSSHAVAAVTSCTDLTCPCTLPAARAGCHKQYRSGILNSVADNALTLLQVLHIIDATLTGIFGLEAIAKIVAFSFAIYFKANSNKVQAFCLVPCGPSLVWLWRVSVLVCAFAVSSLT